MKKSVLLLPLVTLMTLAGCNGKTSSDTGATSTGSEAGSSASSVHVATYSIAVTGESTMLVGRTQTLTALVSVDGTADSTLGVNWIVDNEKVATVDYDSGLVTAVSAGTAVITVCMNDSPYEMTTFSITVTDPAFDATYFPIKDNYTLALDAVRITDGEAGYIVSDSLVYSYAEKGYYSDGKARESILWFDDDLVYPVEIVSATELNYYEGEYLVDDDNTPYSKADVLASFDGTEALSTTDYTFLMYNAKYDADYFVTLPKENESVDALSKFVIDLSLYSVTTVINAYASISEIPVSMVIPLAETDKDTGELTYSLIGEICGFNPDKGTLDTTNVVLSYQFYNFGTSDLGVTPVKKIFHDGGEAGDGDGNGEDFDGGKDDSGSTDSGDDAGDGE